MNKIILQIGLLVFCFSIIFFSQRQMPLQDVLLKSFIIFVALTILLSIIALLIIKNSNKSNNNQSTESANTLIGKNSNE